MQRISSGIAVSMVATATATKASPIGQVISMISDLQAKTIKEGQTSHTNFEEFSEWCSDRARELSREIKVGSAQIEDLQAVIAESTSSAQAHSSKIDSLAGDIAHSEADLKAAQQVRATEEEDFKAEESELTETVGALERAANILEREMQKGQASLVQLNDAKNVASALSAMVQASMMSTADADKLTALVQTSNQEQDQDSESEDAGPAAAAYENKSGNIVETLRNLLDKANEQLDSARNTERDRRQNFASMQQSIHDEIRFANDDMEKSKQGLAQANEARASAEGNLEVATKELAADKTSKSELHMDCMNRAQDFEAETKARGEELAALAKATQILKETESSDGAASFVQMTAKTQSQGLEVVRMIRELAQKQHSAALTQFSMRLASVSRSGDNGFEKITGMISDMIQRLEAEASAAAEKQAHCTRELAASKDKHEDKSTEVEHLTTRINQAVAKSKKMKARVAELQKELSALTKSQAEMDQLRQTETEAYKANKAELERGIEGIKMALKALNDYYSTAAGTSGGGSGIIGMLEVVESDFSKNLAEVETEEEASASDYKKETSDNEFERAEKTKGVEIRTKQAARLDKDIKAMSMDLSNSQDELQSVTEYLSSIEAECAEKPESYEERKARRDAEMEGLKNALNILESETALVQVKNRHLRGIVKHIA